MDFSLKEEDGLRMDLKILNLRNYLLLFQFYMFPQLIKRNKELMLKE